MSVCLVACLRLLFSTSLVQERTRRNLTSPCTPRRSIVQGKPSPLLSSFKLSYYTLLNLLRRAEGSGHTMEYVIQRSFQQFQFERTLPALQVHALAFAACAGRSTVLPVLQSGARW